MGYGATSKGGGGSGSAGGGRKKSGGGKPKSRTFKVKKAPGAAAVPPPPPPVAPAFTVLEPSPEQRARLLAARRRGAQQHEANAQRKRKPVNGTTTSGTVLGDTASANSTATATTNSLTEREARLAFLARQEANAKAARREESDRRRYATFMQPMALAKHQLDALAERLERDDRHDELNEIHRLLEVVLRNAATKSDPKFKLLKASNQNLWTKLLQFPEVVGILQDTAGFEKRNISINCFAATTTEPHEREVEKAKINLERDRINLMISEANDSSCQESSTSPTIDDSLLANLEALSIPAATAGQYGYEPPAVPVHATMDMEEARNFELCHPGVGDDGLGLKCILAILQTVTTWKVPPGVVGI